jgi:outer membrane protein assembly factor BamB
MRARVARGSVIAVGMVSVLCSLPAPRAAAAAGDWATFLFDGGRSGFNPSEHTITPATAPTLRVAWSVTAGGAVATQPVTSNGTVYWGSTDGFEHATTISSHHSLWAADLRTTSACGVSYGIQGSATATTVGGKAAIIVGAVTPR